MSIYAGDELHGDDVTSGPSEQDGCPDCDQPGPCGRGCPYDTGWDPDL